MNKTKIDWADMTWNPVTGCLHGCKYCYARKIVERFGQRTTYEKKLGSTGEIHEIIWTNVLYSHGFDPTFYHQRLDEPQHIKKPQNIFVCSMADLFGEWVPDEWIERVFEACEKAPQHNYLFLTKNPERYLGLYEKKAFPYAENFWFGTTCTRPFDDFVWFKKTPYKAFVSIEPILGPFGDMTTDAWPEWVIIGAETGNRKGKVVPKREWVVDIVTQCKLAGVPVFMKESLRELMGSAFIQEWPEGLRKEAQP